MAHREHIEDLGFRAGSRAGENSPDPKLKDHLAGAPSLYRAINISCELANRTVSNCHMGLHEPGHGDHVFYFHKPSCDIDNPAVRHINWFGVTHMISLVRMFAGAAWNPPEIGVMTGWLPGRHVFQEAPTVRVRRYQPVAYIKFPKSLLALPPKSPREKAKTERMTDDSACPSDFARSLSRILEAYIEEPGFTIQSAAEICNFSPRSLQRILKASGTSYSRLLAEARFKASRRMLQDPTVKIADIARRLGYQNPTHFSRAFRRFGGIGPTAYRQCWQ